VPGHVFHPGHEALHGVTVLIEGASGRTWIGRYHETNERGVVLNDVAIHDPATATVARAAWIARIQRFGVRVDEPFVILPPKEVGPISRLSDWKDASVPAPGA